MNVPMKPITIFLTCAVIASCGDRSGPAGADAAPRVKETLYGKLPDGSEVKLFTLVNANGMKAEVTEYGAILVSLHVPDREGKRSDITHGYDTLEGWLTNTSYFGATVGRFGNRIANGRFTLDGKGHTLATNNEPGGIPCHLHGGIKGFDKVLWKGESFEREGESGVRLTYVSPDGEEGYPGTLSVEVTYTLTDRNELIWEARATTDAPTVLNLVHHSYWNLSGDPATSINDHELTLYADHYLPTDAGLIPTGGKAPVTGTPMDFTKARLIGERVDAAYEALEFGGGYDHAWVLNGTAHDSHPGMVKAARLRDPESGRVMEIATNQPAIQFYGGNFLDGKVTGKGGVAYGHRSALCLETENYPDAPNNPGAPPAVLRPGETYHHRMIHKFSVE
jgi:aldose 1-epimerase